MAKGTKKGNLLVTPRRRSVLRFRKKVADQIQKQKTAQRLIIDLNPILRGWTQH
jgi:hypothetical protein